MNLIRPHVFVIGAAVRQAMQVPVMMINATVPRGSTFRLDYILATYPRTVVAGAQTSPDLSFRLLDTKGISHAGETPIRFSDILTPAGGPKLISAQGWRIEYAPGAIITMEVTGQVAGPIPATISVSYLGQKTWGAR
jgi:hypothetical protein